MTAAAVAGAAVSDLTAATCPYRGLVPFSERDTSYFFGRSAERDIVAANLIAAGLTLFYAPSGVGKSSVLLAGVLHDLRTIAREDVERGRPPEYVPAVVRDWRKDPLEAVDAAVRQAVTDLLPEAPAGEPDGQDLADRLTAWAGRADSTVLLILDQFEEFLLYHAADWQPGSPAAQLARVLSARDAPVNVLVALREDALAGLDRFKGRVPRLFENYLRLRPLDEVAARRAIVGPIEEWNRRHPDDRMDWADDLVDAVVEELGRGRVALSRGAGRGQAAGTEVDGIEAPFLQLVMTRVWDAEREAGSRTLRRSTLDRLGGANRIVSTYLDKQMARLSPAERDIASAAFHHLVTPSGTKVAHALGDLADYTGVALPELRGVLDRLSQGDDWRIVRSEAGHAGEETRTYEIFHDVLAEAVLDWRSRYEELRAAQRAVEVERAGRRRRLLRALRGVAVAAAVAVAVALGAVITKDDSRRGVRTANAARLVDAARLRMADDPELAVLLARESVDLRRTRGAVSTLRSALAAVRSRGVLVAPGGGAVTDIGVSPDGRLVAAAYEDGHVRVWDVAGRKEVVDVALGRGAATGARFSPDGRRVAATAQRGGVRVIDLDSGRATALPGSPRSAVGPRWSETGRWLGAQSGAFAFIWEVRRGRPARLRKRDAPAWGLRWARGSRYVVVRPYSVEVRDVRDAQRVRRLRIYAVGSVQVSPDGRRAAIPSSRDTRIWDLGSGLRGRIPGPAGAIAWDAMGRRLALGGKGDSSARVYDARTRRELAVVTGPAGAVQAVRLTPDGRTLVTADADRAIRVWDASTGALRATLPGHRRGTASLALGRGGRSAGMLISAGYDGDLRIWQPFVPPRRRFRTQGVVHEARHLPDGGLVAATERGLVVSPVEGPRRRLWPRRRFFDARPSPDGSAALAQIPQLREVDLRSGRERRPRLFGPRRNDWSLAGDYDPDGSRIVTVNGAGRITLWRATDHERIRSLGPRRDGRGRSATVAFSPAGDRVVSSDPRGALYVHDLASGRTRRLPLGRGRGLQGAIHANVTAFHPNGRLMAAAREDGVLVWDLERPGRPRELVTGGAVDDLAFSRDGAFLFTGDSSGELAVWDPVTGERVTVLVKERAWIKSVSVSPVDGSIAAVSGPRTARIYDCAVCGPEAELRALARRLVPRELTAAERRQYVAEGG